MLCPRCGTPFEGNFCPRCGTPSAAPPSGPAPAPVPGFSGSCPRCGMVYQGNFCPRCGLPAAAAAYGAALLRPPSSGWRSALSVIWTLTLVGFLIFMAMNFAGLLASPTSIVPGIQGITPGRSANANLTAGSANWSFEPLGTSGATGTYTATGGDPGGALEMSLPAAANVGGAWVQAVRLSGSAPWYAEARLDYWIQAGPSLTGRVLVSVESVPTGFDVANASAVQWVNGSANWSTLERLDVSGGISASGTYYFKVAYLASANAATTIVRFDNVEVAWTTDAQFYFYVPLPLPELLYLVYASQDPAQFLAYYVFIVVAIVAAGLWYTWRDRTLTLRAFTAPIEALGARLRSMSGWVAVAQVWMATMAFQYALILLLALIGSPATSPFSETSTNAWVLLFDYSAASVFEELAFRGLLIGVPMALAALILRAARMGPRQPMGMAGTGRPDVLGAFKYLWGGQLRKDSPREAQLAAWILVFASSLLFGFAHAPGWGWWKVLPAFVVGLGMGYVFVRHGLGASILLHFATDGSLALYLEGYVAASAIQDLLFLGLTVAGVGFLAWYVIYGWQKFRDLLDLYRPRVVRMPVGATGGPGLPPSGYPGPGGSAGVSYALPPATPPPPPPYPPPPGSPPPSASPWHQAGSPRVMGDAVPMQPVARPPNQIPAGYAPAYHPAPYGYPPVRFQCPFCGWVEARYENRRFTCLRCGRTA